MDHDASAVDHPETTPYEVPEEACASKLPLGGSNDQDGADPFTGFFSSTLDDPEEVSPLGVPRSLVLALQDTARLAALQSSPRSSSSGPSDGGELPEVPTESALRPSNDLCDQPRPVLLPPPYAVPFDPGDVPDPLGPAGSRLSPAQLGLPQQLPAPSSVALLCMCKACRLSRESCEPSTLQAAQAQTVEMPSRGASSAERWRIKRLAGPRALFKPAMLRIRRDFKEQLFTSQLPQLAQPGASEE
ncbi:unnamed protein product [Symbiodinium natans]|uniref:Uncharacterized protein n=1 Tax=Symbiodinium natans TaxID=878477 RepID=A0A812VGJ8_9DINO|nr:unnamed protein product [Symbiodinium natans]